ncbi:oligomeric golgi family complex component [Ophiostoma piceae UAMH 11346]|uniref:Conserved oligomeric Golgi complex subunit 1 n=1 Tax=Ophiostoma piceae (strain UAMH 11346) TaxID=1262450 RepID=S3C2R1_OPHP1|nr:oligomeric golgi family complex component [Ophiostoma piceae UAMH 11346]
MVAPEPDVGLLTSSAQIFASNHTLPQIRQIHKALHVQVDDKAARLRTQVGGSYRELLGTADTIVQMRSDMQGAQATLAGMGGRCGRAVVGGKVSALASFVDNEQEQSSLSLAARAKLLEACARTVGRLLSRKASDPSDNVSAKNTPKSRQQRQHGRQQQSWGERLVLASKVLVLSRLLVSSIDETTGKSKDGSRVKSIPRKGGLQDSAVLASIEASKRTLGSLRRRLREIIEIVERTVPPAAPAHQPAVNFNRAEEDDSASDDEGRLRGQNASAFTAATALDDLLRALCAHSLATTSGARDLLWQLLHVRSQAMALAFELDEGDYESQHQNRQEKDGGATWKSDSVIRGLALYTKTLLDVQALLPHKLPEALLGLKRRALLDDNELCQIEGLRLDVYSRWCGEDVQYFKPYIRHDDLDAAQARDMLSNWAERGSDVLLAGLQRALDQQQPERHQQQQQPLRARRQLDLDAIVSLRTRVLQLWIRDSSKARGFDSSELLQKMRDVFNKQMLHVLGTKVSKLRLVGSEVAATLASWQDGVTDRHPSLWGGGLNTDLQDGAVSFVRDVTTRLLGRSDAVAKGIASYATWRHVVDDVNAIVDQLRRQRWDNDVDDIVEDEETIAERQQLLSRQDPQTLHDHLEATLETAFKELNTQIVSEWTKVAESRSSDATKGEIAMYLVRVLREIRSNRPSAQDQRAGPSRISTPAANSSGASPSSSSKAINELGLEIIPALHTAIARVIVANPLEQLTSRVLTRTTVAGRLLWEEPGQQLPLPSTPSPGVFKFLRDLSASMGDAGMDLWSPAALAQLKQQAAGSLSEQWASLLETADYLQESKPNEDTDTKTDKNGEKDEEEASETSENGEKDDGSEEKASKPEPVSSETALSDSKRRDLLTQWLFDIAWLRCGLDVSVAPGNKQAPQSLAELEDTVYERTGLESEAADSSSGKTPRQRVNKSAQEYWKKTGLLFGLLAPPTHYSLCRFSPMASLRNSSWGTPVMNRSRPANTSLTFCWSSFSSSGLRISRLMPSIESPIKWLPSLSSISRRTRLWNALSDAASSPSKMALTKPVCSSSSLEMRLLMSSASLALARPRRCTRPMEAPPSATRPSELKGVSRNVDGVQ